MAETYPILPLDELACRHSGLTPAIAASDFATLEVRRRLKVKLTQARLGNSPLPAIAIVVGFKASLILIQTLEVGG
jgi:hypothetical protein